MVGRAAAASSPRRGWASAECVDGAAPPRTAPHRAAAVAPLPLTDRPGAAQAATVPYTAPIPPALHPVLAFLLLLIGIVFAGWFVMYEVSTNKFVRALHKELLLAAAASVFLGTGSLFLLLNVGIYV